MGENSIFNKREFDVKDKEIAEFAALISGTALLKDADKLHLVPPKDIEKQVTELFEEKKYLDAERLIKNSKETIDRKKYIDSLLSTRSFSYRYAFLPYLKLIDQAIREKSNVSTIVKKDMLIRIKKFLKEQNLPTKEKNMIQATVETWENSFKEKEWSEYTLFYIDNDSEPGDDIEIGSYGYACDQKIMRLMDKSLEKIGLTQDEIEEVKSFFDVDDVYDFLHITTTAVIVSSKKPEMEIRMTVQKQVSRDLGDNPSLKDEIPYGDQILSSHTHKDAPYEIEYDDNGPGFVILTYPLTIKIPLDKILSFTEEDISKGSLKDLLLSTYPSEDDREPKNFEELKEIVSIKAERQIDEIIADKISTILNRQSNVATLSAPKLIHILHILSK